jgi:hypothetical protein
MKQNSRTTHKTATGKERDLLSIQSVSRRSLWGILLFLLLSIGAFQLRGFDLLTIVSAPVRDLLGYPPPAYLVSIALGFYGFSVAMIALTLLSNGDFPVFRWSHLGYRGGFYFFYALSGSLANNFLAVFFICLFLYGIEQVHIWTYSNRLEHQENELLSQR